MRKPNINLVDWDTTTAMVKRATNNEDMLEPCDFLDIADILPKNEPLSAELFAFIFQAFCQIAKGVDPSVALKMKSNGRPKKWTTHDKWMACGLIKRLMDDGQKNKDAYTEVAKLINERFAHIKTDEQKTAAYEESPAWGAFFGKTVTAEILKKWYQNFSPTTQGARTIE